MSNAMILIEVIGDKVASARLKVNNDYYTRIHVQPSDGKKLVGLLVDITKKSMETTKIRSSVADAIKEEENGGDSKTNKGQV